MADSEDVKLARAGHKDLVRCDLSGANLSGLSFAQCNLNSADLRNANLAGADLSGSDLRRAKLTRANLSRANCSGARIRGAIIGVNFCDANLSNLIVEHALFTRCNFLRAKMNGAKFRGTTFEQDNEHLESASVDDGTDFDGVKASRSLSRLKIFEGYTYARGEFRHSSSASSFPDLSFSDAEISETPEQQEENQQQAETIRRCITHDRDNVSLMATSLCVLLTDFIETDAKPNDPLQLASYERRHAFFKELLLGLTTISSSLAPEDEDADEDAIHAATSSATSLAQRISNATGLTHGDISSIKSAALVGATTFFLIKCGCDGLIASTFAVASFTGKELFGKFSELCRSKDWLGRN